MLVTLLLKGLGNRLLGDLGVVLLWELADLPLAPPALDRDGGVSPRITSVAVPDLAERGVEGAAGVGATAPCFSLASFEDAFDAMLVAWRVHKRTLVGPRSPTHMHPS